MSYAHGAEVNWNNTNIDLLSVHVSQLTCGLTIASLTFDFIVYFLFMNSKPVLLLPQGFITRNIWQHKIPAQQSSEQSNEQQNWQAQVQSINLTLGQERAERDL